MNTDRIKGIATPFSRSVPLLVCGSLASAAWGPSVHGPDHRSTVVALSSRAPFALVGRPVAERVVAGGRARYRISIVRRHFHSKVLLAATASNPRLSVHLATTRAKVGRSRVKVLGNHAVLTVKTRAAAPAGRYTIRVRGTAGRFKAHLSLKLTIRSAAPASFSVRGRFGELWPGSSQPVNVAMTNPNPRPISITSLAVKLHAIDAPRATSTLPCSAADFSITQLAGPYPLRVPAHATRQLPGLGVAQAAQPRITMLNRPVNQDGCQGATITLSYTGTATQ